MDKVKNFIDEIYGKPSRKNYLTNNLTYNHIDKIWSIAMMDMSDYRTSIEKIIRNIFVIVDSFSKCTWCIPLKNKNSQTKKDDISIFLTTSKLSPNKIESDRGKELEL